MSCKYSCIRSEKRNEKNRCQTSFVYTHVIWRIYFLVMKCCPLLSPDDFPTKTTNKFAFVCDYNRSVFVAWTSDSEILSQVAKFRIERTTSKCKIVERRGRESLSKIKKVFWIYRRIRRLIVSRALHSSLSGLKSFGDLWCRSSDQMLCHIRDRTTNDQKYNF